MTIEIPPKAPITTTLKAIRRHRPCGLARGSDEGYDKLRKFLGDDYGDDTPIRFSTIIESNGVDDAFWCLRSLGKEHRSRIALLLADIVERISPLRRRRWLNPTDDIAIIKVIEAIRKYARGEIPKEDLIAYGVNIEIIATDVWEFGSIRNAARLVIDAIAWILFGDRDGSNTAWEIAWRTVHEIAMKAPLSSQNSAEAAEREAQGKLLVEYFG